MRARINLCPIRFDLIPTDDNRQPTRGDNVKLLAAALIALAALGMPAVAGAGTIVLQDTMPRVSSTQVSVTVRKAAAFRVVMRTSTRGRTRLYLLGTHAPKGGALIDTRTSACVGAAGSLICKGAYEPLPPGTYTFRVVFAGTTPQPANLELTVRW
jgi:hypothetical protein